MPLNDGAWRAAGSVSKIVAEGGRGSLGPRSCLRGIRAVRRPGGERFVPWGSLRRRRLQCLTVPIWLSGASERLDPPGAAHQHSGLSVGWCVPGSRPVWRTQHRLVAPRRHQVLVPSVYGVDRGLRARRRRLLRRAGCCRRPRRATDETDEEKPMTIAMTTTSGTGPGVSMAERGSNFAIDPSTISAIPARPRCRSGPSESGWASGAVSAALGFWTNWKWNRPSTRWCGGPTNIGEVTLIHCSSWTWSESPRRGADAQYCNSCRSRVWRLVPRAICIYSVRAEHQGPGRGPCSCRQ